MKHFYQTDSYRARFVDFLPTLASTSSPNKIKGNKLKPKHYILRNV